MRRTIATLRTGYRVVRGKHLTFKAASIAFYTLASFVPLIAFLLALVSVFDANPMLVHALKPTLPIGGSELVDRVLANRSGRAFTGGVGLLVTLWSATKMFRALSIAFTDIYGTDNRVSYVTHLFRSLFVLGGILSALGLLAATSVVLTVIRFQIPFPTVVGNLVALAVLSLLFLPFYVVLPPVSVGVWHALPGTVVAAGGWVLLELIMFYYVQATGPYDAFSVLGAVILFVTFLYLAANVLLLGAVVNVTLDAR